MNRLNEKDATGCHNGINPAESPPCGGIDREEFEFTAAFAGSLDGKDVLEIGFGRGDKIPLFVNAGVRSYHGIDFSPLSLAAASERHRFENVTLQLCYARDLKTDLKFDLIVFYDLISYVPVFEMEVIWRKIRKILRPGGLVVFSTALFDNPNQPDHTAPGFAGTDMQCHKQTIGTIMRTCLRHGFLVGRNTARYYGLCRTADLPILSDDRQAAFTANHSAMLRAHGIKSGIGLTLTRDDMRPLVPGAGRILIGCVADNNPKFLAQALRLVQSIRWMGGQAAGANIMVCLIDEADPYYAKEFGRWGAFVRIVPRFSYFHGPANKLRLFDVPELFAYDTVVLLDCDTIVAQDPLPYLAGSALQGKIVDDATVPHEIFDKLFRHFGLSLPERKYRATSSREPTIWYCNSGVLVFPRDLIELLIPFWRSYVSDLIENMELLEGRDHFCEQSSFALAFAKASELFTVPYLPLSSAMNFPLHMVREDAPEEMKTSDPVIIHYHDLAGPDGFIHETDHPFARQRVAAFNALLGRYREMHAEAPNESSGNTDGQRGHVLGSSSADTATESGIQLIAGLRAEVARLSSIENSRSWRLLKRFLNLVDMVKSLLRRGSGKGGI